MVRHILVPTDFSETAAGAFRYALQLAAKLDARVTLLHVYHPSFDLDNPYLDTPVTDLGDRKQEALNEFARTYSQPQEEEAVAVATVQTELVVGFAGEEITRLSRHADLVVMGTTGESRFMGRVFGSVSSYVAGQVARPVLLVPNEAVYRKPLHVMYASNYEEADESMLQQAVTELQLTPESVHFVHAGKEEGSTCRVAEIRYKELLQSEGPQLHMQYVTLACENPLEGLYRYACQNNIDLLIMGTVQRNLLERIFHRSATKGMISYTHVPMMVMHYR